MRLAAGYRSNGEPGERPALPRGLLRRVRARPRRQQHRGRQPPHPRVMVDPRVRTRGDRRDPPARAEFRRARIDGGTSVPGSGRIQFVRSLSRRRLEKWKAALDTHEPARIRHGAVGHGSHALSVIPTSTSPLSNSPRSAVRRAMPPSADRLDLESTAIISNCISPPPPFLGIFFCIYLKLLSLSIYI